MSDTDIELMKLKLQGEMQQQLAQERREQANRDFWKWAIMYLVMALGPVTTWVTNRQVSEKAAEAVKVAKETKVDQGEKLTAIAGGVDATIKSWKAYDTKQPEDMNAAAEAVANAERLIEPVATPKANP
jgi:hypothetical protein